MRLLLSNAERLPLRDRYDADVLTWPERQVVARVRDRVGPARIHGLSPTKTYQVQVWPARHRPVSQIANGHTPTVTLFTPVEPERVVAVTFADPVSVEGLSDLQAACLLNISTAMRAYCRWDLVGQIMRLRGDRLFAVVDPGLRDWVKSSPDFGPVSGALHTPPPGYHDAGSFKHRGFSSGILQLTFFASDTGPITYIADIDLDDAGGLGHVFQVLGHWATGSETHPYDIHQILTFHHRLDPGYRLEV